jgi:PGF-pre-PGF domain-containing protein
VTTDEYAICRYATSDIDYENMSNMTTTGELTHSKVFTFSTSSSGTYYVRCADNMNNTMNSSNSTAYSITISSSSSSSSTSTTNVTTTLPPVLPPQPTTQPPTEEQPAPAVPVSVVSSQPSTVTFQINTAANEPLVIDVPKMAAGVAQTTGISKISIVTKTGLSNVQVSIKPVEKPAEIPNPDKKVLNYIEINFGSSNENIQSAKITFSLKKSDIRKQNIDSGTIKLLRYANGQWQELETKLGFEDLDTLTFEATTPGFSYFAIAGNEIQAPAEQPKVTTTTIEGGEETLILPAPEKKEESPLGLIILILIIAAVAYLYFTSKQKPWSKR